MEVESVCCMGSYLLALDGWNRSVLTLTHIESNAARWGKELLRKNNIGHKEDDIVTGISWHAAERKLLVLLQREKRTEIIVFNTN